jgi:hypothetical protein
MSLASSRETLNQDSRRAFGSSLPIHEHLMKILELPLPADKEGVRAEGLRVDEEGLVLRLSARLVMWVVI